ncbi:MAG TPA: hypothetical protein VGY13_05915 [Solirubrobacteraceae bacterium]|nr:hypothetical protein [Solirubrobacteraceae bacterium]
MVSTADPWTANGYVVADDACRLGAVRVRLLGEDAAGDWAAGQGAAAAGAQRARGILGWSLRGIASADLDGLPTRVSDAPEPAPAPAHPNGVVAIDHVVAISPAFERSVAALREAGLDLRRVREEPTPAGAPRQAFFRLGHEILELVAEPEEVVARGGRAGGPARFWGLALLSEDLERTVAAFAPHVSEIRAAVQPGRRIATVRREAGLGVPLALMSVGERGPRAQAEREAVT